MDNVRTNHQAPGDTLFPDDPSIEAPKSAHKLDSEDNKAELRKLMAWLEEERDLQADNRVEMAIDSDMYDNFQWRAEDAAELEERGQMPLVFNELAPMADWMIGTERRTRVDYRVLPRSEDDVAMADIKTKVLKYQSDVNRSVFVRSQCFSEAVKAGLSWIDDGVRDDPTKETVYKEWESWRNVLHDSRGAAQAHDLSKCRYIFRWRYLDLDVAEAAFPDRVEALRLAAEDRETLDLESEGLEGWGGPMTAYEGTHQNGGGISRRAGSNAIGGVGIGTARRQVRVYEAQYRKPTRVNLVADGNYRGAVVTEFDPVLGNLEQAGKLSLTDKLMMRMHIALFTTSGLLAMGPSPFRHNDFTLTPVWCYRRSRDGLPYGMLRRPRDLQLDLNKRASKANFLINTNQIIAEEGLTDDWDTLRDEASRPDGVMVVRPGKRFELHRDTGQVAGQVEMMRLAAEAIQKTGGVANENLGRQTNAVSGEAIKARQTQGSVVTTEPFDNLRLAVQISGSKELSLVEQFMTEEKVIRLTGEKQAIEWVKINRMEVDAAGTVRVLDDITSSLADFVVSEQDYAGTLRQVMFDSMSQLAQRAPPELAMRLLRIAYEFSDFPNKDAIVQELRSIAGEKDPNKELTPEEQAAEREAQQAQAEALELQRQDARLTIEERAAKVRELNAKAAKLEQGLAAGGDGGDAAPIDAEGMAADAAQIEADSQALMQSRAKAQDEIERLTGQISSLQAQLSAALAKADNSTEVARIKADAEIRKAEILATSDERIAAINERVDAIERRAPPVAKQKLNPQPASSKESL